MAHYAFLDENDVVVEVIVGASEDSPVDWESHYGAIRGCTCKRTSYNTHGGVHTLGGTPFRKNYAGIGYTYDRQRDAFIPPKPFASWVFNEDTCLWDAPVPYPQGENPYLWNEDTQAWVEVKNV